MKHYEKCLCMIMLPQLLVFVQIKQMNTIAPFSGRNNSYNSQSYLE